MKIKSVCDCVVFNSTPTPHPYTHPIKTIQPYSVGFRQPNNYTDYGIAQIERHEEFCDKAQVIRISNIY